MTAEQLEELQRLVDRVDNDTVDPHDGVSPYFAADLARRVIAAEAVVKGLVSVSGDWYMDDDFVAKVIAYREASK